MADVVRTSIFFWDVMSRSLSINLSENYSYAMYKMGHLDRILYTEQAYILDQTHIFSHK